MIGFESGLIQRLFHMNIQKRSSRTAILIACCATTFAFVRAEPPVGSLVVEEMIVVAIDSVEVPASQTGLIAELRVREGNSVVADQELGRLDDRQSKIEERLAHTRLEIAKHKAEDSTVSDLADKNLAQQQQLAKQHELIGEIALRKAQNDVRTLASEKAEAVAKNELDRATQAREKYVDSVSKSEIDGLRLTFEKSRLETQQAIFERQVDALQAKAEQEAMLTHALNIERSQIEVTQAIADRKAMQMEVELQRQQFSLANLAVQRHKIVAPIDGVVVERLRGQGEWVTAGDPVLRIMRLNRLRAEGYVPADEIHALRLNRSVDLEIHVGAESTVKRTGRIVFISPEIDPVNKEVRFWVEFDNAELNVLPGMRLRLSSQP